MPLVVDASIVACWALTDEEHADATRALERVRVEEAHVPTLWWFEVRNVLLVNERRKRLTETETRAFLHVLSQLAVTIDRSPDETTVLALARRHRLTVYDATYLELAQRRGLPLATLEGDLAAAARAEGVALVGNETA
jgi:predicted nucleic acid-binding protein